MLRKKDRIVRIEGKNEKSKKEEKLDTNKNNKKQGDKEDKKESSKENKNLKEHSVPKNDKTKNLQSKSPQDSKNFTKTLQNQKEKKEKSESHNIILLPTTTVSVSSTEKKTKKIGKDLHIDKQAVEKQLLESDQEKFIQEKESLDSESAESTVDNLSDISSLRKQSSLKKKSLEIESEKTAEKNGEVEQTRAQSKVADKKEKQMVNGLGTWEEWSECDRKEDGRQIRKRKCVGSKTYCEARSMESRSCDKPISDEEEDSEDESPPELPRRRKIGSGRGVNPSDDETSSSPHFGAWSKWFKKCHSFRARQKCEDGHRVGFQTRQCFDNPYQCHGPLYRYCLQSC